MGSLLPVLILVLLGYGLVVSLKTPPLTSSGIRLNPCFVGIWSCRSSTKSDRPTPKSLNPCCFGISYSKIMAITINATVLILVLLGLVIVP